jgi:hypothetical protein
MEGRRSGVADGIRFCEGGETVFEFVYSALFVA